MGEPDKAALWLSNIAAYWRARAAKAQNPDAQLRLNANATHYEELARRSLLRDERSHFVLSCTPKHRLLLTTMGKTMNEDIYLASYDAVARFTAMRGPHSGIFDLSAVDDFDISPKFAFAIAKSKPVLARGASGFVVAPKSDVYEVYRSIEILRASTPSPITLVGHIDEALAHFGVSISDFSAVEAG